MSERLRRLAERLGIEASYQDLEGRLHETSDSTRAALLEAFGVSADDIGRDSAAPAPEETSTRTSPKPCFSIDEALGGERAFGVHVNLPALRSRRGWGVGGLAELRRLIEIAATWGADFVSTSPLHALAPEAEPASPYSPLTRRFRHAVLLDPEAVPELASCEEARGLLAAAEFARERRALVEAKSLHPARSAALKRPVLEALHRSFREREEGRATARGRAYASFLEQQGAALESHASFMALRELAPGQELPPPGSAELEQARAAHEERIAFHRFLQFELERQLASLAGAAETAGMRIGLVGDLALGSVRDGAEVWARPERFVLAASLGAPPDPLGPEGQDWDLPPWNPWSLAAEDFAPWRELLRAAFAGAGGLRVDHVLGLVRQFSIPVGRAAGEGAYLRQPSEDLFRVLAEESRRARALVVGEDLGTLPEELPGLLERFGVLSMRVLRFERDADGSFPASESWPRRALALAGTHAMPPLAGWFAGDDLALRATLTPCSDDELRRRREARDRDLQLLRERLQAEGLLDGNGEQAAELIRAVHRFLLRTPSALVALQLEDLLGETEAFNLPGIPLERHASWSRPLSAFVEELEGDPGLALRLPERAELER